MCFVERVIVLRSFQVAVVVAQQSASEVVCCSLA